MRRNTNRVAPPPGSWRDSVIMTTSTASEEKAASTGQSDYMNRKSHSNQRTTTDIILAVIAFLAISASFILQLDDDAFNDLDSIIPIVLDALAIIVLIVLLILYLKGAAVDSAKVASKDLLTKVEMEKKLKTALEERKHFAAEVERFQENNDTLREQAFKYRRRKQEAEKEKMALENRLVAVAQEESSGSSSDVARLHMENQQLESEVARLKERLRDIAEEKAEEQSTTVEPAEPTEEEAESLEADPTEPTEPTDPTDPTEPTEDDIAPADQ
eukprot:TRINITY_DN1251_c0_g1_i1.p1 TRINITY_DN1251_c0_g1~~TRINITY_DN1251_c0_g1_i1.p1  ORF type:complete len:288 (+),score=63.26 TRINITY_DN1251_c0_g1_i1:49-864(+)